MGRDWNRSSVDWAALERDRRIRELMGDRLLTLQTIARRLRVKRTALDLRKFAAVISVLPEADRAEILRLIQEGHG